MVKIATRNKIDCNELLGTFLDHSHYDVLVEEDFDLYAETLDGKNSEENIVAKFRKNVFTVDEQQECYDGLRGAATQSQNRGLAAGPRGERLQADGRGGRDWVSAYQIDVLEFLMRPDVVMEDITLEDIKEKHKSGVKEETRGVVWLRSKVTAERGEYDGWFDKWLTGIDNLSTEEKRKEAEHVFKTYISDTNYAQSVMSGVAGYYGRYPRIPWGRECSYNEKNPELFEKSFPFLRKLDSEFSNLLPNRYRVQKEATKKLDSKFVIDDTVFTTLTVNHNWRTAAHLDAGDLGPGFSNLTGVTNHREGGTWEGGYLILPEYRVAVNLRPGDLLLVANHTAIHGNTPLIGDNNDRLSIVAYFREDLFDVKSWDYESARKEFVVSRSRNKSHPYYRPLWNGVSPGMWSSDEWKQFLEKKGMKDEDGQVGQEINLEDLM